MAIRAKYKGKHDEKGMPSGFIDGVPSRDLDDDEYDALTTEQKAMVRASSVYEYKAASSSKPGGGD